MLDNNMSVCTILTLEHHICFHNRKTYTTDCSKQSLFRNVDLERKKQNQSQFVVYPLIFIIHKIKITLKLILYYLLILSTSSIYHGACRYDKTLVNINYCGF